MADEYLHRGEAIILVLVGVDEFRCGACISEAAGLAVLEYGNLVGELCHTLVEILLERDGGRICRCKGHRGHINRGYERGADIGSVRYRPTLRHVEYISVLSVFRSYVKPLGCIVFIRASHDSENRKERE